MKPVLLEMDETLSSPTFEILAYEETPLGPLCLRRRMTLSEPRQLVTEITLNHEFLMSSLNTDSERALAECALARVTKGDRRVLVGGLGLGYTAQAALAMPRVGEVVVVEYLPEVIQWMRQGLVPLAEELNREPRLSIVEGDVYARLLAEPTEEGFDAILIDVDHSPEDHLDSSNAEFYSAAGFARAARHLRPGGVLALWSYEEHEATRKALEQVFEEVSTHRVSYYNLHVHETFTDCIYTGRNACE